MYKLTFILAVVIISVNTALALPGSGTQEDPWRIESLADFNEFAAGPSYWDDYTRLETDVNLAGQTYSTAVIASDVDNSNYGFDGTSFTGVFDGNGYKITTLTIDGDADNDYLGLFGRIGNDGQVRNLGLEGGSVSGDHHIGGLVGDNWNGNVSNCHSTGSVSGTGNWVGGLVGNNNYKGDVSNCYSTGSVSGDSYIGGLVGDNWNGNVSNCYSTGSVSGTDGYVGGLVGDNDGGVSNCYSTGSVSGDYYIGGLVGVNIEGTVSSCYSTGDVNGDDSVGGLIGGNFYGIVSSCYSTGSVSGNDYIGGLVGYNSEGSVSNCYSTGSVSGNDYIGGLVGKSGEGSSVSNCYSTGSVSGDWWYVGGLVGENGEGSSVSNCYSTGDVNGGNCVGGLVGKNSEGSVSNCYSTGSVSGYWWYVGGIVGENGEGSSVSNCYSTGNVNGGNYVGGLVGWNDGSVLNCFWNTETQTHGVTDSIGYNTGTATNVEGLPTAQMQTKSTFTSAGWDFVGETINGTEDIWTIHETVDYPKLVWKLVNFVGWYEVDFADYAFFANHWMDTNCGDVNDCNGTDIDFSDTVDMADLQIFCDHWLAAP